MGGLRVGGEGKGKRGGAFLRGEMKGWNGQVQGRKGIERRKDR